MAYAPKKKKKSLWDNIIDTLGGAADAIIPGDQSNWRSAPTREEQVTPISRPQPTSEPIIIQNTRPKGIPLDVEKDDIDSIFGQKTKPVTPVTVNSTADIFQTSRPSDKITIAKPQKQPQIQVQQAPPQPKQQYTDFDLVNGKNKEIFGLDVGQYMGDYGKTYDMKVGRKTELTEQDFLKGFDYVGKQREQVQNVYVNKLKEMAQAGDENAKFTLNTLQKNGKLKGDWTDVIESANNEFLGGLPRSGARAIEMLPGDQGTGKWADQDEKNWKGSTEADKIGETVGSVERTGLDMGLMLTPAGWVDKSVKGTKVVKGLTDMNRGAGFVARTLPGSAMFTGADIASQASQGNEQDIVKSAALGTAIDLGLPIVGKIPGVKQAGGAVVDAAGNVIRKSGDVIQAGKANIDEIAGKIRNKYDDMIDEANAKWVEKNPGSGFVPSRVARESRNGKVQIVNGQTPTTDLTPQYKNTPTSGTKPFNPNIQPETQAGIDDLINRSEATPIPEGHQRVFQSNGAGGEKTNWVFDDVDSLRAYKNDTTNPGDTFEFIDVPQGSLKATGNGAHVFQIAEAPTPRTPEPKMPEPMTEWADEYNGIDPRLQGAQMPAPKKDRSISADATMERLRQRAANPTEVPNIAEANGLKPETVERLVRDYGVDKTRSIIQRSSDATNIRNKDAFVVSEAQKNYGKVTIKGRTPVAKESEIVPETPAVTPEDLTVRTDDVVQATPEPTARPIQEPIKTDAPLGRIAQDFYESRKGNVKINFNDIKAMADTAAARAYNDFKSIGSDLSRVARITQEATEKGIKNVDEIAELTADEKQLWKGVQSEMDYMRRRSSLGGKEVSEGDYGSTYFPRMDKNAPPTRDELFQGYRDKKPGSENVRKKGEAGLQLDEISYSPQVISKYIIDHSDSKLLQEERIYRNLAKNNPDLPEEQIRDAAKDLIDTQNRVNNLTTKITKIGRKVTSNNGAKVDVADDLSKVGRKLGKVQTEVSATPRGLTNGDRINSVDIDDNGTVRTVGDYTGLNQFRDSSAYAGTHTKAAGGDRDALAEMVRERLTNGYKIPAEDVEYAVETVRRIKGGLPDNLVTARVEGIYRNAAKSQIMDSLQKLNITNKTLKNDVSRLTNQILREGSIENELSAKIVQNTLRGTNALFRKLNVSSAINELSDMSSFFTVYGKDLKVATPDFKLVKEMGLGELDPALDPYLKAIDNGQDIKSVLGKINEGTRLYKFVETYKAGVFLKTARDYYASKGLTGDALTAQVLKDYRDMALPVDAFTKTVLDDFPLFTQYLTWGARNMQKEGRLLTGQIDAGIMKDKTTAQRIARDLYANIPAKTAFWLASNGLKGTTIMTAFGLTDFTGLTNQDYSGIAEEDKSFFDRTTQFTNISTIASLLNTTIQALEKEQLKEKYKDADYNPYEHANFGDSFINTYTPQFLKNGVGAYNLNEKGYSENAAGRVQYEAPDDPYNAFKSFVFGKNQTENAREYSGRENLVDRVNEGKDPFTAIKDMAAEQLGLQEGDYNRPITEDYSEKYKAVSEAEKTAILDGGRAYNDLLDNMKKDNPDQYNKYVESMKDHVSPEYWNKNSDGGKDLTLFKMMRDRKRQLQKDLGTAYDPLYDLPDDQAQAVLQYKSAATGDDLSLRNNLNKEQWYKDFKARRGEYYDNLVDDGGEGYSETERMKQWNALDDKLGSFYYDAEKVATEGVPEWGNQFPLVFEQKIVNDKFGFGSPESDAFFKANGDAYKAQKEGYDKAQLEVINQMREIEGYPPMSWEAYQQATKVADTDKSDDKDGYGGSGKGGGSDISPNAGGSYSHTGASGAAKVVKVGGKKVAIKKRDSGKKIAIKRGGKI